MPSGPLGQRAAAGYGRAVSDASPPALPLPYDMLGGEAVTRAIAVSFYRHMAESEPELARLHELDADGHISARTVTRFTEFLIEWLGGPRLFSSQYGHPRLRMRHAHVPVDQSMRDAWLRAMRAALDENGVEGEVRSFLERKLADLADFLRNTAG